MGEELTLAEAIAKYGPDFLAKAYTSAGTDYRKARQQKAKTDWVKLLLQLIEAEDLPAPILELHFAKSIGRRWRFDLAWPDHMLAMEFDGGTYGRVINCHSCGSRVKYQTKAGQWRDVRLGGGHSTGKGHEKDAEKKNTAALMGWRVLTVTAKHVNNGDAVQLIKDGLAKR